MRGVIGITKVTGKKDIITKLYRMESHFMTALPGMLRSASDELRDAAITNLKSSMGGGRYAMSWPKHEGADSIRLTKNWSTDILDSKTVRLNCNSSHAAVVELGGLGTALIASNRPYPIGKSQGYVYNKASPGSMAGGEIFMRNRFAIQRGYSYLRRAINSTTTRQKMRDHIARESRKHMVP